MGELRLEDLVLTIVREMNMTALIVTHDIDEAPDLHRNGGYWVNVWAYVLARGLWGGVLTH